MAKRAKLGMFQSEPDRPTAATGCPASALAAGFEPFSQSYLADPYPFFARARREEPVFYSPETGYWVVAPPRRHRRGLQGPRDLLRGTRPPPGHAALPGRRRDARRARHRHRALAGRRGPGDPPEAPADLRRRLHAQAGERGRAPHPGDRHPLYRPLRGRRACRAGLPDAVRGAGARDLHLPRRRRRGRGVRQAARLDPGGGELGTAGRGRAGRDDARHGRALGVHQGPRRCRAGGAGRQLSRRHGQAASRRPVALHGELPLQRDVPDAVRRATRPPPRPRPTG